MDEDTSNVCLSIDIDEYVLAHCSCDIWIPGLHMPDTDTSPKRESKSRFSVFKRSKKHQEDVKKPQEDNNNFSNLFPLGKCKVNLLKLPNPDFQILATDSDRIVKLDIKLNDWLSDDLTYIIKEPGWHEVSKSIVKGSPNKRHFVLSFTPGSDLNVFDQKLTKVFKELEYCKQKDTTLNQTYVLVAYKETDKHVKQKEETSHSKPGNQNKTLPNLNHHNQRPNDLKLNKTNVNGVDNHLYDQQLPVSKGKGHGQKVKGQGHSDSEQTSPYLAPPFTPAAFQSPLDAASHQIFDFDEPELNRRSREGVKKVKSEDKNTDTSALQPSLNSVLRNIESDASESIISCQSDYLTMKMESPEKGDIGSEHFKNIGHLLETAINNGEKEYAQQYAAVLAEHKVKVKIDVDTTSLRQEAKDAEFSIKVYIEDRESSGGCISLKVKATETIRDLKNKMFMKHRFPVEVQSWIIGQRIPKDNETLKHCQVKTPGTVVYLYLVSAKSVGLNKEEFDQRQQQMLNPGAVGPYITPQTQLSVESGDYMMMENRSPQTPHSNISSTSQQTPSRLRSMHSPGSANTLHQGMGQPRQGQSTPNIPLEVQGQNQQGQRIGQGQSQQGNRNLQKQKIPEESVPELRHELQGRVPAVPTEQTENQQIGWQCPACTYLNLPTRPGCEICAADRPKDYNIPKDYKMTDEEKVRLQQEREMEQKVQQVATTRRPEETTDEDMLDNLGEQDLDALLKFNDAMQIAALQQQQFDEYGRPLKHPPNAVPLAPRDNIALPPNVPATDKQLDDLQFVLGAPPGGQPQFNISDDEN